jgi:hypothetical protein
VQARAAPRLPARLHRHARRGQVSPREGHRHLPCPAPLRVSLPILVSARARWVESRAEMRCAGQVSKAIRSLREEMCQEVVLETECSNTGALRLYENLGFFRDKRLLRYYLNGGDAFRLKSPPRPPLQFLFPRCLCPGRAVCVGGAALWVQAERRWWEARRRRRVEAGLTGAGLSGCRLWFPGVEYYT